MSEEKIPISTCQGPLLFPNVTDVLMALECSEASPHSRHLLRCAHCVAPGGRRTHLPSTLKLSWGGRTVNALQCNADQRHSGVKPKHTDGLQRKQSSRFKPEVSVHAQLLLLFFVLALPCLAQCGPQFTLHYLNGTICTQQTVMLHTSVDQISDIQRGTLGTY